MTRWATPETILMRKEELAARVKPKPPASRSDDAAPTGGPFPKSTPTPPLKPPPPVRHGQTLSARRLKVTVVLDAAEVLEVAAVEGKPRCTLRIALPDRTLSAEIAAKSLRRAQAAIRENGVDNIALVLQGQLVAQDVIAEAGLSAQPKGGQRAREAAP